MTDAAMGARDAPSAVKLLALWTRIGAQSFGGGQAVQLYAIAALVDARGWLSAAEWGECWGICQVVPGINLIAAAAITGNRLAGWRGAIASLAGLLVPSIVITVAVAAVYDRVHTLRVVQDALRGVVAAAGGGAWLVSWRLARPVITSNARLGWQSLAAAIAAVAGAVVLVGFLQLPAAYVLVAAGLLLSASATTTRRRRL